MASINNFNPNNTFYTKRLEEKLKTLFVYPVTIVEAPTGYGKTTVIRDYLQNEGKPHVWFNVDTDDSRKAFRDLCIKFKSINETVAHEIMSIGYPYNDTTCTQIATALKKMTFIEPMIFVIDNYHRVADQYLDYIISELSNVAKENIKIVILTQAINSKGIFELVMKKKINHLIKADFEFDDDDIKIYYKKCGIDINDDEADFLYQYTEGWVSPLYLQMLCLAEYNAFEMTVDIENLIGKAIWYKLDRMSQEFLLSISVFKSFTMRQCAYIMSGTINENKKIEEIINSCGFIKYDAKSGRYCMHSILRDFLDAQFEKMEVIFKKEVLKKAGDWFKDNEDYAQAVMYYYKVKDFESILSMDYESDVIYEIFSETENKSMLKSITTDISTEIKKRYLSKYMYFVFALFLDNQKDYYKRECDYIADVIEMYYKDTDVYKELRGEYFVMEAFNNFNNLKRMKDNLTKAYDYLKRPSRVLSQKISLMFGCPSPFGLYHSTSGEIGEEVAVLEEMMPVFYRITDGKTKGMEALFKAEMLMYKGELDDAMKLCEKALYMAATRNQTDVSMATYLVLTRIAYLQGNADTLQKCMDEMAKLDATNEKTEMNIMYDLCVGTIAGAMDNIKGIPTWFMDFNMIERNVNITTLGNANIVYGKYLIMKGEYTKFLSISGQMLKIADIYNNYVYKIYTLLYMAIAKRFTGDKYKAKEMFEEAVAFAEKDNITLPFVENYSNLSAFITEMKQDSRDSEFVKNINRQIKKYVQGMLNAEKLTCQDKNYGLTKRETDVAKLAAQRLSNKEIAEKLCIADSTVKSNLKVIFNKLGVTSRVDLQKFFM